MSSRLSRSYLRALRHWRWGRSHGFGRLIEEDELNPATRVGRAVRKWWWRRGHPIEPGSAMPVWLVGVQRSGTNMIVRGFEASPEFEVHNENDRRAFDGFRLRSDEVVAAILRSSRHRFVLFKPLCDSHRVDHLLDELPVATPGRALWAYRGVDGRVRSALAKFGDTNLRVLADIAAGRGVDRWQAQRLSSQSLDLVRSFDYRDLTPASGAALFWYLRNALYFELGLDRRADVMLISYDAVVADPDPSMRAACGLLGLPFHPRLIAHIEPRSPRQAPLELDTGIRSLCDELQARLDAEAQAQRARLLEGKAGEPRTA
ncbi:MAG: hypothetical protein ACRDJ4_03710 [Actinomycetota bacterium]